MNICAAIVPPTSVVEAVAEVLEAVESQDDHSATPTLPSGGRLRWPWQGFAGREHDAGRLPDPPLLRSVEHVSLSVARFGNTTPADTSRLTKALSAAAAEWSRPRVFVAGGTIAADSEDRLVTASLRGDVEGLETIAREVKRTAQRLGFLLDRRDFRPVLSVARISDAATSAYLEAVVGTLNGFRGEPWTVEGFSVIRPSFDSLTEPKEIARIPIAD